MKSNLERDWRGSLLTAAIALVILGVLAAASLHYVKASKERVARQLAQTFALRIGQRVYEAVSPTYMLAALVKHNDGKIPDFDLLAADLIQEFPLVRAVELAPAGVVRQVYPLRGNEMIIGHDLLKDKERNKEAHLSVSKRQLTVAGPFDLIQGGKGAVARYPVFMPGSQGKSSFWGFAIVLIHIDELLSSAGAMDLDRKGFEFQICRSSPDAEAASCKIFVQPSDGPVERGLAVNVDLPHNRWQLSVAPKEGWITPGEWLAVILVVAGGALLAGMLHFRMLREAEGAEAPPSTAQEC